MPAEPAIGQRIMRRRQALDMTQEELAQRVGVNRSTIGNWESGKHFPKRYLGKVEAVLGISLAPEPQEPFISPELRAMIEALDADERAWVMGELGKQERRLRRREDPGPDSPERPRREVAG